jgi:hypothetical protein
MNDDPISEDLDELGGDTVACPACGREVWDQADRCPHCGDYIIPTSRIGRSKRRNIGRIIFVVLLILAGIITLLSVFNRPAAL